MTVTSQTSKSGKNICFVVNSLTGGGAERIVINLSKDLMRQGHHVTILALWGDIDYTEEIKGIPSHDVSLESSSRKMSLAPEGAILSRLGFIKPLRLHWKQVKMLICSYPVLARFFLRKRIKQFLKPYQEIGIDFDLVVSHLPDADMMCILARLPKLYCCIHTPPGMDLRHMAGEGCLSALYRWARRGMWRRYYAGQNLLGVSEGLKQELVQLGIRAKSLQTIYNPFHFSRIREQAQAYSVPEDDYLIAVGRLEEQKRFDVLIRAYAEANLGQPLLIFGQGPLQERLERLIQESNLTGRVILKGFVENPYPYIKKARVLVLSSDFECLPTVLIEALVLGTPVVSTDCPSGPSEILVDEFRPFLSPAGDASALARNVQTMIQSPIEVKPKHYAKFSHEKILEQYLALAQ